MRIVARPMPRAGAHSYGSCNRGGVAFKLHVASGGHCSLTLAARGAPGTGGDDDSRALGIRTLKLHRHNRIEADLGRPKGADAHLARGADRYHPGRASGLALGPLIALRERVLAMGRGVREQLNNRHGNGYDRPFASPRLRSGGTIGDTTRHAPDYQYHNLAWVEALSPR